MVAVEKERTIFVLAGEPETHCGSRGFLVLILYKWVQFNVSTKLRKVEGYKLDGSSTIYFLLLLLLSPPHLSPDRVEKKQHWKPDSVNDSEIPVRVAWKITLILALIKSVKDATAAAATTMLQKRETPKSLLSRASTSGSSFCCSWNLKSNHIYNEYKTRSSSPLLVDAMAVQLSSLENREFAQRFHWINSTFCSPR